MVNIPRKKKKSTLAAPPTEPSENLANPDMVNLTFTVPREFRQEYKGYANDLNISMLELLKRTLDLYKKNQ